MPTSSQIRRGVRAAGTLLLGLGAWLAGPVPRASAAEERKLHEAEVLVETFVGTPLGVGRIEIRPPVGQEQVLPSDVCFRIAENDRRCLYPAYALEHSVDGTGRRGVTSTSVLFLFRGEAPLALEFHDGFENRRLRATPVEDSARFATLLRRWHRQYAAQSIAASRSGRAIPIVEAYALPMLSRRMNLPLPDPTTAATPLSAENEFFAVLLGFDQIRASTQARRLLDPSPGDVELSQPLPEAVLPPAVDCPDPGHVELERLAQHVPEECFYVHFEGINDFVWLLRTLDAWGGNFQQVVHSRGIEYGAYERVQTQLALREATLVNTIGDRAVDEFAVIGTDFFIMEGASLGLVLQTSDSPALERLLRAEREHALLNEPQATETDVEIAGRRVSFLSTPDNRLRSFYAVDGDVHLVTTSRRIVERFYEAGQGTGRLGDLIEYQHVRKELGKRAPGTVLMHLSDPFVRQLVSPKSRIEMTRRMQADVDFELAQLARLAAQAEDAPHAALEDLVAGGFLPPHFGQRPDITGLIEVDGRLVDSLRGARRTFLPVADVEIESVTASEAEAYERFAMFYRRLYQRMDPVTIAITRSARPDNREQIDIDLHITPITREHLGSLAPFLAPPTRQGMADIPGALVQAELLFQFMEPKGQRLFGGLLDEPYPGSIRDGGPVGPPPFDDVPGFLGSHDSEFPFGRADDAEELGDGYFRSRFGLVTGQYGRELGGFLTMSPRRDVLERVTPALKIEERTHPAQFRMRIGDLGESDAAPACRAAMFCYDAAAATANSYLLNAIAEQFGAPPTNALTVAEELLAAKLVCPLGGLFDYGEGVAWGDRTRRWRSSALATGTLGSLTEPPLEYRSELLEWFHGLEVAMSLEDRTMKAHLTLQVSATPLE